MDSELDRSLPLFSDDDFDAEQEAVESYLAEVAFQAHLDSIEVAEVNAGLGSYLDEVFYLLESATGLMQLDEVVNIFEPQAA